MVSPNMTLDNDTRDELANFAVEMLYDHLYDTIMTNISKLEDNDRYYNWYHGYTEILLPTTTSGFGLHYYVDTGATSGSISTKHFGEQFDASKVETNIYYVIIVNSPDISSDVTLHFEIDKVSMSTDDVSYGEEKMEVDTETINEDLKKIERSLLAV